MKNECNSNLCGTDSTRKSPAVLLLGIFSISTLFFPAALYVPAYFALSIASLLLEGNTPTGFVAISYFGSLPALGMLIYVFSSADAYGKFGSANTKAEISKWLGMLLLISWYCAQVFNFFVNAESVKPQVQIPHLAAPITSLGLWFAGIYFGILLSSLIHKSSKLFGSKK